MILHRKVTRISSDLVNGEKRDLLKRVMAFVSLFSTCWTLVNRLCCGDKLNESHFIIRSALHHCNVIAKYNTGLLSYRVFQVKSLCQCLS